MHETTSSNISTPALIYIAMGLMIARIHLGDTNTRQFNWLRWLQFLVDAARIVMLWPLVLFIEKFEAWLKSDASDEVPHDHG
jgi:hypothetical protein